MTLMRAVVAITRQVSPSIARCELTHLDRLPIDLETARAQHRAYEKTLAGLGCEVRSLPPEPDLPDSMFVEDPAVVLDGVAVIARSGAESRRPEADSIAAALESFRPLDHVAAPGTLDGGDVLVVGRTLFVGRSSRTNPEGAEQLRRIAAPHGYTVAGVDVNECLHLKSAATRVGERILLANRAWVDTDAFGDAEIIEVDPAEPAAANALLVGETVVLPAAYPRTRDRLQAHGIATVALDVSEVIKAEGGVTCCSLIFEA
jgi:dimethylargininase